MKLPGQLEFGVQRRDAPPVGEMRAAADAEQQADLAWGAALSKASNAVADVAMATGQADANQTLSERIAMDKRSTAELDAWLASNQSFDTMAKPLPNAASGESAPVVPEAVLRAAEKLGLSGRVNVFDIAVLASQEHMEATTAASKAAINEKDSAQKHLTNYNQQMDNSWAKSAGTATQVHTLQRIQHLAARADMSYTTAINSLDEQQAMQIIVESEQSGIWTPEYASTKLQALGPAIDEVRVTRMYRDATTQGDLDEADVFANKSRIAPDERIKLMALSDQMQDRQYQIEMRKQPINYGHAMADLINGTLTKSKVAEMADNQDISGAQAHTLMTSLNAPTPLLSTPEVFDRLIGDAAGLRFSKDGDPTKITKRAEELRNSAYAQFTGLGQDGQPIKKSLTGADFEKVIAKIDEYENIGLGKGGQNYSVAVKSIDAHTGYSSAITKMIKGPYPAGQAKAAFDAALQEYMSIDGSDPINWVTQNAHRFSADLYAKKLHERLAYQFPAYKDEIMALVGDKSVSIKGASVGAVLWKAQMDYLSGRLGEEQFSTLANGLDYLIIEADSVNNNEQGVEQILPGAQ